RMNLNKFQRILNTPESTEKIPRKLQRNATDGETPMMSDMSENVTTLRRGANDNFPEGHPDRPYNVREPEMIGSKTMDDSIDASWKKFADDQKLADSIHDQRKALIDKNVKSWNEFDLAKFNKLGKKLADIYG